MRIVRRVGIPFGFVLLAVIVGVGLRTAVAQDTVDDLRAEREESRRDAALAAAEIDALAAEDVELVEGLAAIDAHIALQEAKVDATRASIEDAEAQIALARAQAAEIGIEIEFIRERLRERAVDAYVSPGGDLDELDSADLMTSALRRSFLEDILGDEYELVDELRVRVAEQEAAERAAEELAGAAESERAELERRLAELDDARLEAEQLRAEVQIRIAEWQVVSDEIAEADRLIAEEIRLLEEEARRIAAQEEARRAAEEEARRLAEAEAARRAEEAAAAADDEAAETDGDDDADPADDPNGGDDEVAADDGSDEDGDDPDDDGDSGAPSGDFAITHRPVPGVITSPFGDRIHPIFGTVRAHNGLDLNGSTGDPIAAAADGIVLSAGWRNGYGNTVVLSHGGGYTTLYAHQTDVNVSAGDAVAGGDLIGWVGSTGWSTGPHLHFEVRLDGVALDPVQFF